LRAPRGGATRPTSDKVREAIFDVIGSLNELDGLSVADLFAGSGAMGIEALSRGASKAVFVDRSPVAVEAVRANLASTGLAGEQATVVGAEAASWLGSAGKFDVVFVDPPYAFTAWEGLFDKLDADLVVLESDRPLEVPLSWEIVKSKRYGGTLVTVVRPAGEPEEEQKGIS
jgi:16S rRNA (guanine966-N2)-methyltransferase